jgi:hypothetical protein
MTSSSWLSTDEIWFLFAFLMHNIDGNTGFLHVLSPSITKNIHDVHDVMPVMMEKKNTPLRRQKELISQILMPFLSTLNQGLTYWSTSFSFFCAIPMLIIGCQLLLSTHSLWLR